MKWKTVYILIIVVVASVYADFSTSVSTIKVHRFFRPATIVLHHQLQISKSQELRTMIEAHPKGQYEFRLGTSASIEFIDDEKTTHLSIYGDRVDILRVKNESSFKAANLTPDELDLMINNKLLNKSSSKVISFDTYKIKKSEYLEIMTFINGCLKSKNES